MTIRLLLLYSLVLPAITVNAQDRVALAREFIPKLEKNLTENIASFWFDKSLDRVNGGYTINFGPQSEAKGPGTKMIVTQARTVWFFSRLARAGYRRTESLAAAEHGYRFLLEKMWDQQNGGFFWEVDATGKQQIRPRKHLYGQSFALYAISEYARASGKTAPLEFANGFFHLLEAKAHDSQYGGYIEFFNADWTSAPPHETPYLGGGTGGLKLMNTHLHLLEAITTYYRASREPLALRRLLELIAIESNAVVRKDLTACTDKYQRDWTPVLDGNNAIVSYGHDIENIWLLMDACQAAGLPDHPFLDLYRSLFAYSLKHGYDADRGGFFYFGPFNLPATNREKSWWVQAEVIVSALYMYKLTGEQKYLDVFRKTYQFIEKYQTDWEHGEWHATIMPDGSARGDKAQPWKAGYHNGRAMIECIELLKQFSGVTR